MNKILVTSSMEMQYQVHGTSKKLNFFDLSSFSHNIS